jgi:hypothetical protein
LTVLEVIDTVGAAASCGPPLRPLRPRCEALSAAAARAAQYGVDLAVACCDPAVSDDDAQEDLDRHQSSLPLSPSGDADVVASPAPQRTSVRECPLSAIRLLAVYGIVTPLP